NPTRNLRNLQTFSSRRALRSNRSNPTSIKINRSQPCRSLAKAALCSPFRKQIDRRRRRTGRNATLARHSHGLQLLLRKRTRRLAREMLTDWSNARNYDGKAREILHERR